MDLLKTAVVDITTLVATCHALKSSPIEDGGGLQHKLRGRLRREFKRGTIAYIEVLARTRRGAVDDALLAKCRVAAEQQLPHALVQQALLRRIMGSEAGSLGGMAATRQDLWRLASMAIHLSIGMAALRGSVALADADPAEAAAARLRRRLRKALIAYARATLRAKSAKAGSIVKAREAATAEIEPQGAVEAERLAHFESRADPTLSVVRQGVTKPLLDLTLDWRRLAPVP